MVFPLNIDCLLLILQYQLSFDLFICLVFLHVSFSLRSMCLLTTYSWLFNLSMNIAVFWQKTHPMMFITILKCVIILISTVLLWVFFYHIFHFSLPIFFLPVLWWIVFTFHWAWNKYSIYYFSDLTQSV